MLASVQEFHVVKLKCQTDGRAGGDAEMERERMSRGLDWTGLDWIELWVREG